MEKTKMQHCKIKGSVEGEDGLKAEGRHRKRNLPLFCSIKELTKSLGYLITMSEISE